MSQKPSDALIPPTTGFPKYALLFTAVLVIANIIGVFFSYHGFKALNKGTGSEAPRMFFEVVILPSLLLGTTASLAASLIYLALYHYNAEGKLKLLQTCGPNELLRQTVDDLHFYNHHVCHAWNVKATLSTIPDRGYFSCTMEHHFRKTLPNPTVSFKIKRGVGLTVQQWSPSFAHLCLSSLFVWTADESTYASPPQAGDYQVSDLRIDNRTFEIRRTDRNSNELSFEADIPETLRDAQLHEISFTVRVAVENASAICITHQWPTMGSVVRFNYAQIPDIDASGFDFAGMNAEPSPKTVEREISYELPDSWALPRSGYCFAWWRKDEVPTKITDQGVSGERALLETAKTGNEGARRG